MVNEYEVFCYKSERMYEKILDICNELGLSKKEIRRIGLCIVDMKSELEEFKSVFEAVMEENETLKQKIQLMERDGYELTTKEALNSVFIDPNAGLSRFEYNEAISAIDRMHSYYDNSDVYSMLYSFNKVHVSDLKGCAENNAAMLVICWHFGVDLKADYSEMKGIKSRAVKDLFEKYSKAFKFAM